MSERAPGAEFPARPIDQLVEVTLVVPERAVVNESGELIEGAEEWLKMVEQREVLAVLAENAHEECDP